MIQARGLARTFKSKSGPVEAVRGVDFEVSSGGRRHGGRL
jgi:ABC-2 type transport system ATP-binding protein